MMRPDVHDHDQTNDHKEDNDESCIAFPDDFVWGTATASFQIEGGIDDRGRCIWDDFCPRPGKVYNGETGDVADDHYHRYVEDVA